MSMFAQREINDDRIRQRRTNKTSRVVRHDAVKQWLAGPTNTLIRAANDTRGPFLSKISRYSVLFCKLYCSAMTDDPDFHSA